MYHPKPPMPWMYYDELVELDEWIGEELNKGDKRKARALRVAFIHMKANKDAHRVEENRKRCGY